MLKDWYETVPGVSMLNKFIVALIMAAGPLHGMAQSYKTLTEADVVKLALERNELNAISKNQLKEAEYRLKQAKSYLYPKLTANAVIQKMYIVPEKRLPGGLQINQGNITLTQPIYTFGRLSSGVEIADLDKDITANSVKATRAEIEKTAKQLYYNAVYMKNLLKIAEESVANANKNKSALGDRVQFGRINQNDNLKMQADVASREPLLHEAKRGYEASLQDLASFLNIPRAELGSVDSSLEKISKGGVKEKRVEEFVDVRNAEKTVRLSAAQKELAKSDYMPTLSAFASYSPAHTPTDVALPGVLMTDTAAFGLRLDFELPLGGGKAYESKIRTVAENSAMLNLQRVKRDASKQQTSLIQQYQTLADKSEALKRAVDLAERAYKVALASFRNGSISQLQLNDSEILLTQNKISYVQNILQMKIIETELERLQTEGKE